MCLGVPGQIVSVAGGADDPLRMGVVDFGGVRRKVALVYVPEAGVGDYCLVHVGFAIGTIDEREALETRTLLAQLGGNGDLGPPPEGAP